MSDDKLLKALAAAARKDNAADQLDARWDDYSKGNLSDDEIGELLDASRAQNEPDNTEEAFRPLGDDFQASVLQQAKAESDPSETPVQPSNTVAFPGPV